MSNPNNVITAPTLKDVSLLVSVTGGKPKMTMKDMEATRAAATAMNASTRSVSATKELWPKHLMQPVITAELAVRNTVKMYGIPYARNLTLVANSLRLKLDEAIKSPLKAHEMAVEALFMNYAQVLAVSQMDLGSMYDPSVYPSATALKSQFKLQVIYLPAPDIATLAIDEFGKSLQQQMEVYTTNILQDGTRLCVEKLAAIITNMSDKLRRKIEMDTSADPEINKRSAPRFHDSLMQEMEHLFDVIPELNFSNDLALDNIVREAKSKLRISTEVLKNGSLSVKQQILSDAENILSRMQGMY